MVMVTLGLENYNACMVHDDSTWSSTLPTTNAPSPVEMIESSFETNIVATKIQRTEYVWEIIGQTSIHCNYYKYLYTNVLESE